MISYEPLWETMKQKNVTTYALINKGISSRTISNIRNNKGITLHTLEKLCRIIDCRVEDIIEFIAD